MIYDCFSFFNELDLLEIRLNIMNDVVDRFVLVEATKTFQMKDKPMLFAANKERFKPFLHKIDHIVVDTYPTFWTKFRKVKTWDYHDNQKEAKMRGLKDAKPDDTIIVSDLDEIPRPDLVAKFANTPEIKVFQQRLYYYYLNCFVKDYPEPIELYNGYKPWQGTVMMKRRDLKSIKKARLYRGERHDSDRVRIIREGGWHFSYLGGVKAVIQKIEAYSHKEHNVESFKDPKRIEALIKEGKGLYGQNVVSEFVNIDETFPQYIRDNQDKYSDLILHP